MSYKIVDAIMDLALPKAERATLIAMARHANDDGSGVTASVARLAREAGYKSVRTIQTALAGLSCTTGAKIGGRDETGKPQVPGYEICTEQFLVHVSAKAWAAGLQWYVGEDANVINTTKKLAAAWYAEHPELTPQYLRGRDGVNPANIADVPRNLQQVTPQILQVTPQFTAGNPANIADESVCSESVCSESVHEYERENQGHLGTSVVVVPLPTLSHSNTLLADPDPDPQQQGGSAHALAAALGEVGAGSAAPINARDVQQLAQLGATADEVQVGWALLAADLAGKPFTPSVKLLAKQWAGTGDAGWQSKARAEIAKRAKAERAAREAQERRDREAAAQERRRLQVEAEEQRRAALTPEEREAEDQARAEEERRQSEASWARQAEQRERIRANFARAGIRLPGFAQPAEGGECER